MKISKKKGLFALTSIILLLAVAIIIFRNGELSCDRTPRSKYALIIFVSFIGDAPPSTPTAINCSASPRSVTVGSDVTINGFISPAVSGVTVTLTYTKPDATTIIRNATSGTDGSFHDTYTPSVVGSWSVKASWLGNVDYLGATSFAASFTVNNPGTIPMEYVYLVAAIVIILIAAIVVYWYIKKK